MDLKEAVEFINRYRRTESDPDLLTIETCVVCGEEFPSLVAGVSLRRSQEVEPKCRICFREERRAKIRELQRERRRKKREDREQEQSDDD